jgi:hypothetical protein
LGKLLAGGAEPVFFVRPTQQPASPADDCSTTAQHPLCAVAAAFVAVQHRRHTQQTQPAIEFSICIT